MKEFSQKHSVVLLWSTIILLVISITLSVCAFCGRNYENSNFKGGERGGMMQNGGRAMNSNGFRNFNKNNFSNNQDTTQTPDSVPAPKPAATDTVTQ